MIAKVGHGDPPADGNTVTLRDYLLYIDAKIRKGPTESAMDGLEGFRPDQDRVRIGKAVRLALFAEHFVDRCFTLLVPHLLEPALQEKFVGFIHRCPSNVGRSLEHF